MSKKGKQVAAPAQIVFNPIPLVHDVYMISADLDRAQRAQLRLAWHQLGTSKKLIVVPTSGELQKMPTSIVRDLMKTCMTILGERGEFDKLRKQIGDLLENSGQDIQEGEGEGDDYGHTCAAHQD